MRCTGGPDDNDFTFSKTNISITDTKQLHNWSNPQNEEVDILIGKTLSTTRNYFLKKRRDEEREKKRKENPNANLSSAEIDSYCKNEHQTSICDLIYRMRLRSNYDNPDMYVYSSVNPNDMITHYKNLDTLTRFVLNGLETIIEKKIGRSKMAELKSVVE